MEQGKNSSEAKELVTQIKDLNGDIKENKDKLNEAEKATDELGNEMDETAKQTNIFGEVLKANLAADFIKSGDLWNLLFQAMMIYLMKLLASNKPLKF